MRDPLAPRVAGMSGESETARLAKNVLRVSRRETAKMRPQSSV
jgi:hypothetical protein